MKRNLLILLFATACFAQQPEQKIQTPDHMLNSVMSGKQAEEFSKNYEKITLTGTVDADKSGFARIDFVTLEHKDGFIAPPACTLTKNSKIKRWEITNNRQFATFYTKPKQETGYSCIGWVKK